MMLPILISPSVTPGPYFFCAAAGSACHEAGSDNYQHDPA
jgi:hypothetical protein